MLVVMVVVVVVEGSYLKMFDIFLLISLKFLWLQCVDFQTVLGTQSKKNTSYRMTSSLKAGGALGENPTFF